MKRLVRQRWPIAMQRRAACQGRWYRHGPVITDPRGRLSTLQTPHRFFVSQSTCTLFPSRGSSSSSSLDVKWQETTQSLLDPSITSSLTPRTIHQFQETLKYYMGEERQDLVTCWNLLDALMEKKLRSSSSSRTPLIPRNIIQPIVHMWQRQWKDYLERRREDEPNNTSAPDPQTTGLYLPSQLAKRLEALEQAKVIPLLYGADAQQQHIPAMILDVASHISSSINVHKEGVYFANDYLQSWIRRAAKKDTSAAFPDVVAVGTVLQAWATSGLPNAPERAEEFYHEILQQQPHLKPNAFWYNSLVAAWAHEGNAEKAMEWVERMQQETKCQPDLATWNSLLSAWAKQEGDNDGTTQQQQLSNRHQNHRKTRRDHHRVPPNSAEIAESVLQQMQELHRSGQLAKPPDVVSYSIVLDAWAHKASGTYPYAAERAQQLLEQMKQSGVHPNRVSYNTTIRAHARAGNPQQAEALLLEMLEVSSSSNTEDPAGTTHDFARSDIRPNHTTVAAVLTGWSQVGTWEAAERAERILNEFLPQLGMKPDLVAYSACLACWAKIPAPVAAQGEGGRRQRRRQGQNNKETAANRAQALFDQLKQRPDLQPDVIAYTNLMNVCGKHGQAGRVEELLQELIQSGLKPNVHTLSVVVSAWARSRQANGAEQAEAWLDRMAKEFRVMPNVVSYTSVLQAWAHRATTDPQAPDRARALLERMEALDSLKPNGISYSTVLKAYAAQGRSQDAEALLKTMLDQPHFPTPDVYAFATVLYGWSRTTQCGAQEAAQSAEELLMRMHDLYQSSVLSEPPNVHCFANVLLCWSRVPDPKRAEAVLRVMEQYGVAANIYCINIVMNTWANQAYRQPEAIERARSLLDHALESKTLQPDEYTYRAMFKALYTSSSPNRYERVHALVEEMRAQGIAPSSYIVQRLTDLESVRGDAN